MERVKIMIVASSPDGVIIALLPQDIVAQSSLLDGIRSLQMPESLKSLLLREDVEQLPLLKVVVFPEEEGRATEGLVRLHNARRPKNLRVITKNKRP